MDFLFPEMEIDGAFIPAPAYAVSKKVTTLMKGHITNEDLNNFFNTISNDNLRAVFNYYLDHGIITMSDLMDSNPEGIMIKILQQVHKYDITPPGPDVIKNAISKKSNLHFSVIISV